MSPATDVVKETAERLPQVPLQEHVFADCSRERILGLLAAMLPPVKPVRVLKESDLSELTFKANENNRMDICPCLCSIVNMNTNLFLNVTTQCEAILTDTYTVYYRQI